MKLSAKLVDDVKYVNVCVKYYHTQKNGVRNICYVLRSVDRYYINPCTYLPICESITSETSGKEVVQKSYTNHVYSNGEREMFHFERKEINVKIFKSTKK